MNRFTTRALGVTVLGLALSGCGERHDLGTAPTDEASATPDVTATSSDVASGVDQTGGGLNGGAGTGSDSGLGAFLGLGGEGGTETITFDDLATGQIVTSVTGSGGSGPIGFTGFRPRFDTPSAAIVFDSSNPTGGDFDLGSPNIACGGPGIGGNVGPGTEFENCTPLGKILIIAETLRDDDGDGLVDDPDDIDVTALANVKFDVDFSLIGPVTVERLTVIDIDGNGPNPRVDMYDGGGTLIASVPIPNTMPNNGVTVLNLGPTAGVVTMAIRLHGSGGINDLVFSTGEPQLGQIGDTVYCDLDDDGIQDFGEPGLEGVTVDLVCTADADGSVIRTSTVTDENGFYLFTDLPAGECIVTVDASTAPPDCNETGECPPTYTVELDPGEVFLDADFCFKRPELGQIGDTVWCDLNDNGVQENGEPGLEGVVVNLRCTAGDGSVTQGSMTTNSQGKYLFTDLPAGTCVVTVDVTTAPPDCNVPGRCPTTVTVELDPGEVFLDADFCFKRPEPGEIGDTVWCDLNDNGVQDNGEPGLEGVVVNLRCTAGDGSVFTASQSTSSNGMYLFTGVPAGECEVTVDVTTAPPDCDEPGQCPTTVTVDLGPGESYLDADFCFKTGPPEDCCENGKPAALTMVYTGQDCSASDNTQNPDKVRCIGDPNFEGRVRIIATEEKKEEDIDDGSKIWFDGIVDLGGSFVLEAANGGEDHFKSNTYVYIFDLSGNLIQDIGFHTSCSQPLFTGDQFGSLLLTGCRGEDEPGDPGDADSCDDGDPQVLTMRYTGEDCSASSNAQNPDKVDCSGDPQFASLVRIKASDDEDPDDDGTVYFEGTVALDGTFDIDARNADRDDLKSETWVHIMTLNGATLQTVGFHTSCSQPLRVGDQFGSLVLDVFIPKP